MGIFEFVKDIGVLGKFDMVQHNQVEKRKQNDTLGNLAVEAADEMTSMYETAQDLAVRLGMSTIVSALIICIFSRVYRQVRL